MAKQDLSPLVLAAQRGDQQALSDLLEASYRDLYFYAYQTVKNEDLAADITQESCLEIISTISQLREPNAFVVWARRITYHQCTRFFRESKEVTVEANEEGETIFDQIPDENEGVLPEQVQLDKEFRATMQQLLDELPAQQRTALMLYYYEKLSVNQIAQIQDTTEGTVKSRLNYGRKAVKAKVEEYEKKTGLRLHSIAPLPLLLFFLFGRQNAAAMASASLGSVPAVLSGSIAAGAGTAAGTAATGAAAGTAAATGTSVTTGAGTAAAATGISLGAKIAAGVVAAAVCIGGTIGGVALINNLSSPKVPAALVGTWYGDQYTEEYPNDVLILEADGALEFHGYTFDLVRMEKDEEDSTGKDMDLYFVYETERPDCGTCTHTGVRLECTWLEDGEGSDTTFHEGPGYLIDVHPLIGEHANGEEAVAPFYKDPRDAHYLFHHYYQRQSRFQDDIWGKWILETDGGTAEYFILHPNHRITYNGNLYHWRFYGVDLDEESSIRCYNFSVYDISEGVEPAYCCRIDFRGENYTPLFNVDIEIDYTHKYHDNGYLACVYQYRNNDVIEKFFIRPEGDYHGSLTPNPTEATAAEITTENGIAIPNQFLGSWTSFPDEEGYTLSYEVGEDGTIQIGGTIWCVHAAQPSVLLLGEDLTGQPTRRLVFHSNTFGIPALELQKLYPGKDEEPRTLEYFWRNADLEHVEAITLTDENWHLYIMSVHPDTVVNSSTESYLYFQNFVTENSWAEGEIIYTSSYHYNTLMADENGQPIGVLDVQPGRKHTTGTTVSLTGHTRYVSYPPKDLQSTILEVDGETRTYTEHFFNPAELENVTGIAYIPKGFDAQAYYEEAAPAWLP